MVRERNSKYIMAMKNQLRHAKGTIRGGHMMVVEHLLSRCAFVSVGQLTSD
jgi:hypothetical protein